MAGVVKLKEGKERKVLRGYPWIQRGECQARGVEDGAVANLVTAGGDFLAVGTYNSRSRFRFRVLSLQDETIDAAWFAQRFQRAKDLRSDLGFGTEACRVLYSEADGVPGLIVDRYGPNLVVQVRSLGQERLKDIWLEPLIEVFGAESAVERSEMAGRQEEGLEPYQGVLHGSPPEYAEIVEDGLAYSVPLMGGLKTGHYLDQRRTRNLFGAMVRPKEKVLDAFCYTGGFAMQAARSGASVTALDILPEALDLARKNLATNGLQAQTIEANAFEWLQQTQGAGFDWIVLDPPAIAKTGAKRDSLKWAIWKLVHASLPNLSPGGRLIVCNCSYQLSLHETIETCRLAAGDRGRRLVLERTTMQDTDHPAPIHFPEALYLKCAWLRSD
ncbi:MAG: class I SAM-dependent rRNA methyltransferase [Fimbriimonadaceae bacterium]